MSSKSGHQSSRLTPALKLCYPMAFTSLGFILDTFHYSVLLFLFRTSAFSLLYKCTVTLFLFLLLSFVTSSSASHTNSKIRFLWYLVLLYFKSLTLPHFCYLIESNNLSYVFGGPYLLFFKIFIYVNLFL